MTATTVAYRKPEDDAMTGVLYVRKAKVADIPWLMAELEKFAAYYGVPQLFPSKREAFTALSDQVDTWVFYIAAINGKPVALCAGEIIPHPYNSALFVLVEKYWWTAEAHRGSRAGLLVFEAFLAHADQHHLAVSMSLLPHSKVNERTLTKRGFRLVELTYLKETAR
jgi:hypothetical protein